MDEKYLTTLLAGWEATYKKGMLSFWLLHSLSVSPSHMAQLSESLKKYSADGTIAVDKKSIYRALRRLNDAAIISFTFSPGKSGAEFKIYELTDTGWELLDQFIKNNILPLTKIKLETQ